jgi:hypothetical protein
LPPVSKTWCTKPWSCKYLHEFSKIIKTDLMVYSGAWGNLFIKKPEVENLMALSLLYVQTI